jgi:hypothetical protein
MSEEKNDKMEEFDDFLQWIIKIREEYLESMVRATPDMFPIFSRKEAKTAFEEGTGDWNKLVDLEQKIDEVYRELKKAHELEKGEPVFDADDLEVKRIDEQAAMPEVQAHVKAYKARMEQDGSPQTDKEDNSDDEQTTPTKQ